MERKKVGATHKKRTTKKPAVRRHKRRISGANDMGGMALTAGGLIAGSVAARELNTIVSKMVTLSPIMSGIMQMAAGFILPKFIKGPFFDNMGKGMIANGGMVTIVSTGIISGTNDRMAYRLNGTSNLRVVSGTPNLKVITGPQTRISNQVVPRQKARTFRTMVP